MEMNLVKSGRDQINIIETEIAIYMKNRCERKLYTISIDLIWEKQKRVEFP